MPTATAHDTVIATIVVKIFIIIYMYIDNKVNFSVAQTRLISVQKVT